MFGTLLLFLTAWNVLVSSHTWIEDLRVIADGYYAGIGYSRQYVPRTKLGFLDAEMTHLLPPLSTGRTAIDETDMVCSSSQSTASQSPNYPRLQASPGSYIALRYLENGHVTIPENTPGKPARGGLVYVLGSTSQESPGSLKALLQYTNTSQVQMPLDILTVQYFDDGRCYQLNDKSRSIARQSEFPNPSLTAPYMLNEQWCETIIKVPQNLTSGSTYTLYWVWQWPTQLMPGITQAKDEYYTTCSDLDIVSNELQTNRSSYSPNPQVKAVDGYKSRATSRLATELQ